MRRSPIQKALKCVPPPLQELQEKQWENNLSLGTTYNHCKYMYVNKWKQSVKAILRWPYIDQEASLRMPTLKT